MTTSARNLSQSERFRYRLLIAFEIALIVATVFAYRHTWSFENWLGAKAVAFSAVLAWHIVAISICILYLMGRPVGLVLFPLSAEAEALIRRIHDRSPTEVAVYCSSHYSQLGIPLEIPDRVRKVLNTAYSYADRIMPLDRIYLIDDEVDLAEVFLDVGEEFGIRFSKADYPRLDGTFDNLVRLVYERVVPRR